VRSHAPWRPGSDQDITLEVRSKDDNPERFSLRNRAPDIQASMTVLGRRPMTDDTHSQLFFGCVDLRDSWLPGANLSQASFYQANFRVSFLRDINFDHAHLVGADLSEASLFRASLRRCNLHDVDFKNTLLEGANLEGSYLQRADLRGANLNGANFRGTRLQGTLLKDAKVEETDFTGSRADSQTLWPEGFDPKAAGVIFAGEERGTSHG
jgi:uncharacterized protein YjbI with pentapeptide repeats